MSNQGYNVLDEDLEQEGLPPQPESRSSIPWRRCLLVMVIVVYVGLIVGFLSIGSPMTTSKTAGPHGGTPNLHELKDIHYVKDGNFTDWVPIHGCVLPPPKPFYLEFLQSFTQACVISQIFGAVNIKGAQNEVGIKDWVVTWGMGLYQFGMVFVTTLMIIMRILKQSASHTTPWHTYTCYGTLLTEGPWMMTFMTMPLQYLITTFLLKLSRKWQGQVFDPEKWSKGKGAITERKVSLLKLVAGSILLVFGIQYLPFVFTHVVGGFVISSPVTVPIIMIGYCISHELGAFGQWRHIQDPSTGAAGAELQKKIPEAEERARKADEAKQEADRVAKEAADSLSIQEDKVTEAQRSLGSALLAAEEEKEKVTSLQRQVDASEAEKKAQAALDMAEKTKSEGLEAMKMAETAKEQAKMEATKAEEAQRSAEAEHAAAKLAVEQLGNASKDAEISATEFQFVLLYLLPFVLSMKLAAKIAFNSMVNIYVGMSWHDAIFVALGERQMQVWSQNFVEKVLTQLWQVIWLLDDST